MNWQLGRSGLGARSRAAHRLRLLAALAALLVVGAGAAAAPASATTWVVNTTSDVAAPGCPDEGGNCSLRQALDAAVAGDVIALPAGADHYAADAQFVVTQAGITVQGGGTRGTTIDGGDATRIFQVAAGANLTLTDLTLTGGNGSGGAVTGQGGAALVLATGTLALQRVTVDGNAAAASLSSSGGGLQNAGTLTIMDSTLSGNAAPGGSAVAIASGGAIQNSGVLTVTNSTFSGNVAGGGLALGSGGAINTAAGGTTALVASTLATNSAGTTGSGGNIDTASGGATTLASTILSGGVGAPGNGNCGAAPVSAGHNLDSGTSCGLGAGDVSGANPLLGSLQDNGGPTNTRALGAGSPALDSAGAACPATDQRGIARPQGSACDIGAFELQVPPPPETPAGTPPPSSPPPAGGPAPPILGVSVNLTRISGIVLYKLPGSDAFVDLPGTTQVPLGTVVDASRGVAGLVVASDATGGTQSGQFSKGVFQIYQSFVGPAAGAARTAAVPAPITDLLLRGGDFATCPRYKTDPLAALTSKTKSVRKLFSNAKGRFRTRGRYSSAVVRGTQWTTEDRCDGTLTSVTSGVVEVYDNPLRKAFSVPAGKSHLAKPRECVSRRRFHIHLRNPVRGTTITSASITVNGRHVRTLRGARVAAGIDLRGLPKGPVIVRIRARLSNGRVVHGARRYLTCSREPRRGSGLPLL